MELLVGELKMKNEKIKVSIILPIYNVEKYIEQCLESINKQTYKNIEIILVDDGSPDNCGKIIDEYAKKDIRVKVIHKENSGVSAARNSGLEVATGDYVCFADPDDILSEDYIEYLLNLAIHNDVEIALTKSMNTTENVNKSSNDKVDIISGEKTAEDILLHKIPIGVYCKIFKRTFLENYKIRFRTDIYIGEGFNFNTASFQRAKKIAVGYKCIYFYRTDNQSSAVTKFSEKKWWNALYALDSIEKDLYIKSKSLYNAIDFARWYDGVFILSLMKKNKILGKYIKLQKKCVSNIRMYFISVFNVSSTLKQKIKAILMLPCPVLMGKIIL